MTRATWRTLGWAVGLLLLCAALPSSTAHAERLALPIVLAGDGVTVRAQAGLERDARKIIKRAPTHLAAIRSDLVDLPAPGPIEIRLVRDSSNLPDVAPAGRGAPGWAAGVAYSDAGVVSIARWRRGESIDIDSTLAHELAHIALDKATGGNAPRWLHEGFAYIHASEYSMRHFQTLVGMAWTGNTIHFGELSDMFALGEDRAVRAYAQSYDFVTYLARRGRYTDAADDGDRWPFRRFLVALSKGKTIDEACRETYNATFRELIDEWRRDLRNRYLFAPAGLFGIGVWAIGGLLLVLAYIRRRRQAKRKMAEWDEAEAAASAAPAMVPLATEPPPSEN